jgi:hypothetical protein
MTFFELTRSRKGLMITLFIFGFIMMGISFTGSDSRIINYTGIIFIIISILYTIISLIVKYMKKHMKKHM